LGMNRLLLTLQLRAAADKSERIPIVAEKAGGKETEVLWWGNGEKGKKPLYKAPGRQERGAMPASQCRGENK